MKARMGIHVGEATPRDGDYLAPVLNRLARVLGTGYGEQILLTEAAAAAAGAALPPGCDLIDLGAHRLRDLLQAEHIYQLRGPELVVEFPPLKSLDRQLHNLPAQPTALLGRETEIAAVRELLEEDGVRLITLTGPGGTGKTRLGLQVGAELMDAFADGVWFVPLAAVGDADLVVPAIAQPLGVREVAGEPLLKSLQDYLQPKRALLLLDNFEHVTAAAPDVAALLGTSPNLKVLVTSREPLRISGEHEIAVPPLALPQPRQVRNLSPAALLEYPAIRLFVERAQGVKRDFALSEANANDVAAICQRLDGLPLAIELAAARVRVLPPAQLLDRLEKRLSVLTGGNRDLPMRQQTLRAAIEWSYDLLSADDRVLFARLAVFAGGCTWEAAAAVCSSAGDLTIDVLDGIDSLTQKSLLRQEEDANGESRFTMLETIREFGVERLEATGDIDSVRHAHGDYYLNFAEVVQPELTGPTQIPWLNRLETEHDNLRAALGWSERTAEVEVLLRLAGALWRFWWMRGHLTEGRGWLERSLVGADGRLSGAEANARSAAGILAESQGDYDQAVAHQLRALELRRQIDDRVGIASSLANLGTIERVRGDLERAAELHTEALSLWTEIADERGIMGSLYELGLLALDQGDYSVATDRLNQSLILARKSGDATALGSVFESLGMLAFYSEDYERAAALYEESLKWWRAIDDSRMIAHALANLGEVAQMQGDLAHGEMLYKEAIALFRELGEKRGRAFALYQLGTVLIIRGEMAVAANHFAESLELRRQLGDQPAVIETLEGLAEAVTLSGEAAHGARLFGAAEAHRFAAGTTRPTSDGDVRQRALATGRAALGTDAFNHEMAYGRALSLDQAIAEALTLSPIGSATVAAPDVTLPVVL